MSTNIGTRTITQSGREVRALVDAQKGRFKVAGVTIDWTTVATNPSDTTLPDGTVIPAGTKYLRYGQPLVKITASGKFGPVDTSAADGRQTVDNTRRGEIYILNRTVAESELGSDVIGDVFDGGNVFSDRLVVGGANQATLAQIQTAMPGLTFTKN